MTSPELEEEGVLREWSPVGRLLQEVPSTARRGLFFHQVSLTAVDAVSDCLVIATSSGIVYSYHRALRHITHLYPEKTNHPITSVKIVSSVDYMVAAGDEAGVVTIFRVPKPPPDWLPHDKRDFTEKGVERYTVGGLHTAPITTLEWSINGQKLFSGDAKGHVVYTEIDFCMNLSKAREIFNENYSIVQLSYNQQVKALIVSTLFRCIICYRQQESWKVVQVGQKERNCLLGLGGVFYSIEGGPTEPIVYCGRPGLRLWQANLEGTVQQTIIYKDRVKECSNAVKLLRGVELSEGGETEFGRLLAWRDGLLVSHAPNTLLVLDPTRVAVVASLANVKNIVSVAVTRSELFLICGHRDLIRLAYSPDLHDSGMNGIGDVATGETVSSIPHFTPSPVTGTIMESHFKVPPANRISVSTPESVICASEVTYGTDTVTLPPIVALHEGVVELRIDPSRVQKLNAIGEQGFDDNIIFTPRHRDKSQKHKNRRKSVNSGIFESSSTYDKQINNMQSSFSLDSFNLGNNVKIEIDVPIPTDILPDLRSIESIVEDVKQKELLLEASLIFPIEEGDEIRLETVPEAINVDYLEETAIPSTSNSTSTNGGSEIKETPPLLFSEGKMTSETSSANSSLESNQIKDVPDSSPFPQTSLDYNNFRQIGGDRLRSVSEFSDISLNEVPLQDSPAMEITLSSEDELRRRIYEKQDTAELEDSATVETEKSSNSIDQMEEIPDYCIIKEIPADDVFTSIELQSPIMPTEIRGVCEDWQEIDYHEKVISIAATNEFVLVCCPRFNVYSTRFNSISPEVWQRLDYKAQHMAVSPDGQMSCKIHCGLAQKSKRWEEGRDWEVLCRGVQWVSVAETGIWYVTRGELFHLPKNSDITVPVPCEKVILKVYSYQNITLVITESSHVLSLEEENWRIFPGARSRAKHLAIGPRTLIWFVDKDNNVFVTDNLITKCPKWWQVIVGNGQPLDVGSICTTDEAVFISNSLNNSIYFNSGSVTGYKWEPCGVDSVKCLQLTAEGVFEDKGSIWILTDGNKLIRLAPFAKKVETMKADCNIVCIASAPQVLWILSEDGRVYVRKGISDAKPIGTEWLELDLEQLHKRIQLSHISCGCDVVWACDIRGNVLMLVGSPHSVTSAPFPQVWVHVDGSPISNNTFTKVYVGPQSHMVWALDNAGNVYVREAIFPYYLIGTGWVHVNGIKASHLSISVEAVWALGKEGVYKRLGISESNYIGDTWLLISVSLDHVSASVSEGLWGICSKSGHLFFYQDRIITVSSQAVAENDWILA